MRALNTTTSANFSAPSASVLHPPTARPHRSSASRSSSVVGIPSSTSTPRRAPADAAPANSSPAKLPRGPLPPPPAPPSSGTAPLPTVPTKQSGKLFPPPGAVPRPATATSIAKTQPGKTSRITATTATTSPFTRPQTARPPSSLSNLSTSTTSTTRRISLRPATISSSPASSIQANPRGTTPLRPRDHNAALVRREATRPKVAAGGSITTMAPSTFEKGGLASRQQPQMPSLSATAAKALNRAPLTPKIATKTTAPPPVVTPIARRVRGAVATTAGGEINGAVGRDDSIASPVSAFLSNNITPRSGSRQSRVEHSASSTPTSTPNPDRHGDWDNKSALGVGGTLESASDQLRRQAVTFSPTPDAGRTATQDAPADSKFFYASDAKKDQPPTQSRIGAAVQQQKGSSFFYANGASVEGNKPKPPVVAPAGPSARQQPDGNFSSKFVYASGMPDLKPSPKLTLSPSGPGSTVSTSSRMTTTRGPVIAARPQSPIKLAAVPGAKGAVTARQPTSNPSTLSAATRSARRVSIESGPRRKGGSHSRSSSLASNDAAATSRTVVSLPSSEASSPTSVSGPAMSMATILQAAEDLVETEESPRPEVVYSELHSPTKSTHSTDQLSELVANARRERKVQDLEITNASLEAINRTLERQLRKQTAELRRYRRLSRSGRLSLASTVSTRIPSDSTAGTMGIDGADLSDLSEDDEEERDPEDEDEEDMSDFSDSESASGTESLGSAAREAREAKRRQKDERRLQLDLSKHRQLLVDSQKMNQSLKRCLNWTEELIKEGRKALEYNVRVSDVELGGRVLQPHLDEDDERDHRPLKAEGGQGEERHDINDDGDGDGEATLRLAVDAAGPSGDALSPPAWTKNSQDRDSGIELPVADGGYFASQHNTTLSGFPYPSSA